MEPDFGLASKIELRNKLYKDALEKYYIKNPHKDGHDLAKIVLEVGAPIAAGGLLKAFTRKGTTLNSLAVPVGIGAGLINSSLGYLGRGQKHVREMGVDSNLLGYKARPLIQDPNKKNFR